MRFAERLQEFWALYNADRLLGFPRSVPYRETNATVVHQFNCCLSEHPNQKVPPQQVQPSHKALQTSKAHRPIAAYMEAEALHILFVPSCHRTPQANRSPPNRSMHAGSSSARCLPATGCYKQAAHPPTAACMQAAAVLAVFLPQGATSKLLPHQQQHAWVRLQCCSLGGRSWSTASCRRAPPGTPALAGQSGAPRRPPHSCSSETSEVSPQPQQSKQQNLCTQLMNTVGLRFGECPECSGRRLLHHTLQPLQFHLQAAAIVRQAVFKLCNSSRTLCSALPTGCTARHCSVRLHRLVPNCQAAPAHHLPVKACGLLRNESQLVSPARVLRQLGGLRLGLTLPKICHPHLQHVFSGQLSLRHTHTPQTWQPRAERITASDQQHQD